ncbi:phage integrase N-terminal SAM-like domain-containing protein [Patescibacteria group bacterium]|nr:phage integrase N-terminal SAM-like domain-containing protein [Patescibacteria group bacterium]
MNSNYQYPSKNPILQLKQEMKLRRFSDKTIKSYLYYITNILKFANKNPKTIYKGEVKEVIEKIEKDKTKGEFVVVVKGIR